MCFALQPRFYRKKRFNLKANEKDIEENKEKLNSAMTDRLILSEESMQLVTGLRRFQGLDDPVEKIDSWSRPNGLKIDKVSIPLGNWRYL